MAKIEELKQRFPKARENVVLRDFTTIGVGGVADLFFEAENIVELAEILFESMALKVPYFVLGGGSNIIVSDNGFPGVVIKNNSKNIVRVPETSQLIIDSGVVLSRLIAETAQQGLTGIEFLTGIPGTVGGAVYGNAGCFGNEICQFIKELTILHPPKGQLQDAKIVHHKVDWMEYSYRSSRLKRENKLGSLEMPKPVILTIKVGLAAAKKEDILWRINQYKEKRKHLPKEKTCGCVFKNPERNTERSAGAFIDRAKLKRAKIGNAFVSPKHANYIINKGRSRASDVRELIEKIRFEVKDKFGVNLEEEVEYVGRW